MTLLSVVRDVCAAVGVTLPQSVFSNITGNRTMQEMLSTANEMAQRIAYDQRDWTKLIYAVQVPGDGIAQGFNLPANFKRLMLNTGVYRLSTPSSPMRFIADYNEWLSRTIGGNPISPNGEWIIIGEKIYTNPIVAAGDSIHYSYIDKNCVALNGGGFGDVFMNDLDTFRIDERLLKLGMIYQWKAQKGSSYAEDMSTFGDALTMVMGHDKPAPIFIDRKRLSPSVSATYYGAMP
jgi:hypothetical protein